jgi:SAM-dependent methyltransferase
MTDEKRAIRENAKYLRQVRPIDPEEIYEYIESQPHPAVVRQTLREEAVDLGLVETDDGTFVPVDEEPVTTEVPRIDRFPEEYGQRLEDLLVGEYGPDWATGESGEVLRDRIRKLKDAYYRQNPVEYDYEAALAYAIYHLPDYYAVVQYALSDLIDRRLLPRKLRVLDVGAGVGGPALGLCDLLPDDALVEYHAVEPSEAETVLSSMLDATGRNVHTEIHSERAESFDPSGEFDLILFGNVLSELSDPTAVATQYLDALAPDGSMVALAPADRNTSTELREVERALADDPTGPGATVYSPTIRLWPGESPTDRGWSFDVKPDLAVPSFQQRIEDAATDPDRHQGEFVNVDVQFSHSILRTDGKRRLEATPDPDRWAKMAEMEQHVSNRIDLLALKLSHSLSEGDANPLFKISDGSESVEHYAVLTRETALNRDLVDADYGDLLAFESVLALWNDDEGAYNLVVDGETVVDAMVA